MHGGTAVARGQSLLSCETVLMSLICCCRLLFSYDRVVGTRPTFFVDALPPEHILLQGISRIFSRVTIIPIVPMVWYELSGHSLPSRQNASR